MQHLKSPEKTSDKAGLAPPSPKPIPTGIISAMKSIFRKQHGKITLTEYETLNENGGIEGSVLIEGFPGVGMTSILATGKFLKMHKHVLVHTPQYLISGYLADQLKLPVIASISSTMLPPKCVISKGFPSPSIRLLGNKNVVVCVCEFKIPEELVYDVADALLDFVQRHSLRMVFTIDGLPAKLGQIEKADKVRFITTDKALAKTLLDQGHVPFDEAIIPGISGLLLTECPTVGQNVTCVYAPTSVDTPEVSSAVCVVRIVGSYLGIPIDTSTLEEKAKKLEAGVKRVIEQDKEASRAHDSMYL